MFRKTIDVLHIVNLANRMLKNDTSQEYRVGVCDFLEHLLLHCSAYVGFEQSEASDPTRRVYKHHPSLLAPMMPPSRSKAPVGDAKGVSISFAPGNSGIVSKSRGLPIGVIRRKAMG